MDLAEVLERAEVSHWRRRCAGRSVVSVSVREVVVEVLEEGMGTI